MGSLRRGYLYGVAAYTIWGFAPLYFKLLDRAGAVEILAHRVIWSVVFMAVLVLLVIRQWGSLRRPGGGGASQRDAGGVLRLRRPRALLGIAVAGALVAVNWGGFIYGVTTDRVVEVSLGYFINPLVTVLLGVLALRERLRRWQWVALGTGTVAVAVLTVDYGRLPWVALMVAGSFGLYGLVKKTMALPAAEGLLVETSFLSVPALAYLWWLAAQGTASFGTAGAGHTALLIGAGAVTSIPLLLFAGSANRIPLSVLGILQYVGPTLQFLLGVLVFAEPMPPARWAGFGLVWAALVVFTADMLRAARSRRAATLAPPDLVRG
jgi:chloramphenicol-sensitive protein RarD